MNTQRTQQLTLITAIVVALVITGIIIYSRLQTGNAPATTAATGTLSYEDQPALGEDDAPVKLAVFEDFKCPFCRQFDQNVLPQLTREYIDTGQAQLHFINFSFIGPDSTTAALAGECAYRQNEAAFWDYKTIIFRAQGPESQQWATPSRLQELAENVGDLDAEALRQCINDEVHADAVAADNELARAVGVTGTPTLFVGDQQVASALDYDAVSAAIDEALND